MNLSPCQIGLACGIVLLSCFGSPAALALQSADEATAVQTTPAEPAATPAEAPAAQAEAPTAQAEAPAAPAETQAAAPQAAAPAASTTAAAVPGDSSTEESGSPSEEDIPVEQPWDYWPIESEFGCQAITANIE